MVPTPKITGTAVVALLASTVTAADWDCNRTGGGGHGRLRQLHDGFNRVFGSPRLHMASGQCYFAKCHDHYFGVCNRASKAQWEKSGDRNHARNANPESGSFCGINPSPTSEPYLIYIFSHAKDLTPDGSDTVRQC
ncbi:hypothetical protein EMPG_16962 [Blastomyces silverae]|uniref:Secreted protein n=1 Tax=Blastomyces silverae TaxID=2060906 RepID=A0A0H1B8X9_9EURO|nr:hypothetical protein EMPG_16962 [Blastomyces silverae]